MSVLLFLGRRIGGQTVSLDRAGCIFLGIVQHELLHLLGFHHEQNRSDRDSHVQILFENIIPVYIFSSLDTPHTVCVCGFRFAFSKNKEPTIIPDPDGSVYIGRAEKMSTNDIPSINRLYCSVFKTLPSINP
ncbi:high choriolytic enzyme 1-like [Myxocyprinus asiaticus]|uniref:high choriolytic enzyme 1-like n=1 Tax=Myxocyprinus asiaticus TaxID=70543 RepID=UPI002223A5C6|nr:high choriolytic enzyme 1-like [Myxocyprinus asiaticus]